VEYAKEIIKTAGLNPERIQMFHCSAAEGQRFQQEVTRISEVIEKLGSNPVKQSGSNKEKKEVKKSEKKEVNR